MGASAGLAAGESWVGRELEVEVGPVAHGGHCVARVGGEHGRVVFVRHALPGERVRVRITEDSGGAFCRGDAVDVQRASPDRVSRPCEFSGPGRCGGCDFQHVDPAAQRRLKAHVVSEQLLRLAGLDVAVEVGELAGGPLGWRTRIGYATAPDGRLGLRRHRSHEVEVLTHCPLGAPGVGDAPELSRQWPGTTGVEVGIGDAGRTVLRARPLRPSSSVGLGRRGGRGRARTRAPERVEQQSGPPSLRHRVLGREFEVSATGFWQVHPQAAPTFVSAVLAALRPAPGERVVDLYAGAGLFTAFLADAVGPAGRVVGIEGDATAVADAVANLAGLAWAEVRRAPVSAASVADLDSADLVVLDPPRSGAERGVIEAVLGLRPRAVAYVACDPAAFARDVRLARDAGWSLAELQAFDSFPMTHHVECVGLLVPRGADVSLLSS